MAERGKSVIDAPVDMGNAPKGPEPALLTAESGVPNRWITWRSVLLGTLAVIIVTGLTPFNDYVVVNTFLISTYLPLIVMLSFFLLVLINAPLHRYAPSYALRSGELAVVMVMMLVACCLPSTGLMRYFMPLLVAPFHFGAENQRFWSIFLGLELPGWMYPVERDEASSFSWIVRDFYGRVQPGTPIPFSAWVTPLIGWGVFIFGMFAVLLGMAFIIRPQWAVNERLPFPLAQIQMALIEPPEKGRMLNNLFRSRAFWAGLLIVFVLKSMLPLNAYFPQYVPEIELPLRYDFRDIFADEPWVHLHVRIRTATLYFTFVGITYFIQSRISFSLWSIFLITQMFNVQQRMIHNEIPDAAWQDQHLGASVAFLGGVFWVGRHHWKMVLAQTFRGRREDEPPGEYLSYRVAMFMVITGLAVMLGWLTLVGVAWWVSLGTIFFILLGFLVVGRVVAETGFPIMSLSGTFSQVYTNFSPEIMNSKDVFMSRNLDLVGSSANREGVFTYALHGLNVHQSTRPGWGQRVGLVALIGWALVLGFVVASASSLYCYYNYATPLTDEPGHRMINPLGLEDRPLERVVNPVTRHEEGQFAFQIHNSWLHMGIGAGVTALLQVAALRWSAWPFMPVGYLTSTIWFVQAAWFSLFLGWLAKVVIVKYGGASFYQAAKPFFIGLIFGEMVTAGLWMLITLGLALNGYEYKVVTFLA